MILKNLKSVFIVEDETNPQQELPQTEKEVSNKQDFPPPPPPPSKDDNNVLPPPPPLQKEVVGSGTIDKRLKERLLQAIDAANLEGFDYLEFRSSIQALASLPLDEATRYKSAFATAGTMGLTVDKLLQTAAFYRNIIEKEREKIKTEMDNRIKESLGSKQREKEMLEQQIQAKQQQIQVLNEQMKQHQQQIEQIQQYMNDVSNKVEETRRNFALTFDSLARPIDSDIEKIKLYLK